MHSIFVVLCSLIADWDGGLEDDSEDPWVSRRPWYHCHWQWHYIPNRFFWASRGCAIPEGFRACSNTWHPPYLCGCQQWSQDWFGWGDSAHVPCSLGRPRWPIQGKDAQESEVKLCSGSQKNLIFKLPLLIEVTVNIWQSIRYKVLLGIGSLRQQDWHPEWVSDKSDKRWKHP